MATPSVRRLPRSLATCRDLTVAYGSGDARVVALDRVDVQFAVGETVALWGPSGSGKTTLLHALGGLVEPTDGVVLWNGRAAVVARRRRPAHERAPAGSPTCSRGRTCFPCSRRTRTSPSPRTHRGERDDVEERALELLALVGLAREGGQPAVASSPAARRSASRSPARSHRARGCCSATSRPATSTPTRPLGCSR